MKILNPDKRILKFLLPHLNQEFIIERKRTLMIEHRFPSLLSEQNFHNLFCLFEGTKVVSFLAIKPLQFEYNSKLFNFFLIGLVYTLPEFRGKNFASNLLTYVSDNFLYKGFDAGILWSTKQNFYTRLGWEINDNSVLINCANPIYEKGGSENESIIPQDYKDIKDLISKKIAKVKRDQQDYLVKPIPSENLHISRISKGTIKKEPEYSIYGLRGNELYFYEYFDKNSYLNNHVLLNLCKKFNIDSCYLNIFIKDYIEILSDCQKIFSSVNHEIQSNRMMITNNFSSDLLKDIYIPYSDRI